MADSRIVIFNADGQSAEIDIVTESGNNQGRQVIVIGDPSTNDARAAVRAADPNSDLAGIVVRDPNSTAIVSGLDSVRVRNLIDGTVSTISRVDRVFNVIDGTMSTIYRVANVVDGTISTVSRVSNVVDGTISAIYRVFNVIDGTISLANVQATAVVNAAGGSVAGSTSAVSTSGFTLVSPEANRNIKIYAFSLTTTAQVHNQVSFTNGSGASPTTFWQVALQAPSQGIAGANLAVTPPGYLFATGSNTTLALVKDTASLVHYSVSYFKESA